MTALIHHCKNAEQFEPVADTMMLQLKDCVKTPADVEKLRRILEITTVAASVRQGSRLTRKWIAILREWMLIWNHRRRPFGNATEPDTGPSSDPASHPPSAFSFDSYCWRYGSLDWTRTEGY